MPSVFKRQNSTKINKISSFDHQSLEQCHLIFRLPEIVEQIVQHLIPNTNTAVLSINSNGNSKIIRPSTKMNQDILPCLYVNWLWHDCVSRYTWRHVSFDDSKTEYEQFLKFASVISRVPLPNFESNTSNIIAAAALAVATHPQPLMTTQCDDDQQQHDLSSIMAKKSDSFQHHHDDPTDENCKSRILSSTYQHRLRSLTLRKIKERNINEPLQHIGYHATQLTTLDIYICDYVTNAALYPFLEHGQLTYLSLAGCQRITDEAIIQVANKCPGLEHLDLRACGNVSDASIGQIALCCRRLRHLNVGRVRDRQNITDQSIQLIATHTQVAVLGLAGCDVSDTSLTLLARERKEGIERISINNCYKVSNQTILAYARHCPRLSVFEMKECHHIHDWDAVAQLVRRKVLLTLCDQQSRACNEWAKRHGIVLDVKAPVK
ncbi:uncharacterized protein BX664DRAFT_300632 [Halteromyces radiatus]|uniref:uncharacterized protein n=1 Tax=Halteromyces radiatus TaxID=101107 RepID=UPI002220CBDB|nr:uncharacterized protein BX664DRAFT_300632 [Halteromyces radiatus]KAI8084982.1 hypothetical protein BX664DRAFT_300632 [Halteromyces radiatus]